MSKLKPCPFCGEDSVFIGVHDDEGNYHGRLGCEYESDHWSGLSYALHHEGWGECILCTDGENEAMGGVLFDTAEEVADEWNRNTPTVPAEVVVHCINCKYKAQAKANNKGFLICPASGMEITDNDFCSYGERRESGAGK